MIARIIRLALVALGLVAMAPMLVVAVNAWAVIMLGRPVVAISVDGMEVQAGILGCIGALAILAAGAWWTFPRQP